MSDMTKQEIEDLLGQAKARMDECDSDPEVSLPMWVAEDLHSALRQLMNEQKWRPIDDEAKQGVVLISDNDKFSKAAIWDEAGDAEYPWKFFDSDGTINRVMAEYVTGWRPLPSPPETSDE